MFQIIVQEKAMILFSVFCYMLVLNGICGWAGFAIWKCMKGIWAKKGQYRLLYHSLKFVLLLFLIPWSWIYLTATNRYVEQGQVITRNWYPWVNPRTTAIIGIFFLFWLCGAAGSIRAYRKGKKILRKMETQGYRVSVEKLEKLYPGFAIPVYRCPGIHSPIATGILKKRIYLPDQEYGDETLRLILEHERTHFQHMDLLFKNLCAVLMILYWFCPWVKLIFREYDCWSEEMCDMTLCTGKGSRWSAKEYYSVIVHVMEEEQTQKLQRCTGLCEDRNTLEWRIRTLKHYHDMENASKWIGGVLVLLFLLSTPAVAVEAGNVAALGLRYFYEVSMTWIKETETETDRDLKDPSLEKTEQITGTEWIREIQVNSDITCDESELVIQPGETVVMSGFNLNDVEDIYLMVKIQNGDGNNMGKTKLGLWGQNMKHYVEGIGNQRHLYQLKEDGEYAIFVENTDEKELTVTLGYSYVHVKETSYEKSSIN